MMHGWLTGPSRQPAAAQLCWPQSYCSRRPRHLAAGRVWAKETPGGAGTAGSAG